MDELNSNKEQLIRNIIESVYKEMGDNADPETVKEVVRKTIQEIEDNQVSPAGPVENAVNGIPMSSNRIIITAFGQNRPGMVAAITEVLARNRCNIEDISQKILQDIFALILIVDIKDCPISLRELKDELGNVGNKMGIRILVQHEDVFNFMHRI